jgi:hypothetical protein
MGAKACRRKPYFLGERRIEMEDEGRLPIGSWTERPSDAEHIEEEKLLGKQEVLADEGGARGYAIRFGCERMIGVKPERLDSSKGDGLAAIPLQLDASGVRKEMVKESERDLARLVDVDAERVAYAPRERSLARGHELDLQRPPLFRLDEATLDGGGPHVDTTRDTKAAVRIPAHEQLGAFWHARDLALGYGELYDTCSGEGPLEVGGDDVRERTMAVRFETPDLVDDRGAEEENAVANELDGRIAGRGGSQKACERRLCARELGGSLEESSDRARGHSRHD